MQRLDRFGGRGLDGIGDAEQAGWPPIHRDEYHRLPLLAQRVGTIAEAGRIDAQGIEQSQVADGHRPAVDRPDDALAGDGFESANFREHQTALPRAGDDRRGQRMLADVLEAGGKTEQRRRVQTLTRLDGHEPRLAFGERPGLVDDDRRDLLQQLQRFGIADQHARFRAPARADHDRHRRREAERTRTRDDEHRHGVHQRVGEPRLGARPRPHHEGHDGHGNHDRYEPAGHGIGEALNRRPRSLGVAHHPDDLRQERVAPDAPRLHHDRAGAVDGASGDRRTTPLLDRDRFPRHHRFVDRRRTVDDDAVDRHALAGPDPQPVADDARAPAERPVRNRRARAAAPSSARGRAGCGWLVLVCARARSSST